MKNLFLTLQFLFFGLFNLFLLLAGYQLVGADASFHEAASDMPKYNLKEDYDPSLTRLTSIKKISGYCDSLYEEKLASGKDINYEEEYSELVSEVVKKRFYHGYSHYSLSNNYMASFIAPATIKGLSAIVIPDDILKYPYAACSQQSIVMMEVLRKKGLITRKVGLQSSRYGHFCFEVHYNGSWHFFDPDLEPDENVLRGYQRPGIAFLAKHPDILTAAYKNHPKEMILDLFPNYSYGTVNTFPAPKAIIFQKITKFLSYTIWSFFLLGFVWARIQYKKYKTLSLKGKIIKFPIPEEKFEYYPARYQTRPVS